MIGLIDKERFDFLVERNNNIPIDYIDEGFRGAIQALNTLEGICTVWCCEGHKGGDDDLYLTFVVSEDGVDSLTKIDEATKDLTVREKKKDVSLRIGLTKNQLRWIGVDMEGKMRDVPEWYPNWTICLGGDFNDPRTRKKKSVLLKALEGLKKV